MHKRKLSDSASPEEVKASADTVYVVLRIYHYDDYKRAESDANVCGVFKAPDDAYKFAIDNIIKHLPDYLHNYDEGGKPVAMEEVMAIYKEDIAMKEKYEKITEKAWKLLGEPQYTMQPSHEMFTVSSWIPE